MTRERDSDPSSVAPGPDLSDFEQWARIVGQLRLVPAAQHHAFLARLSIAAEWSQADAVHKAALVEALADGDMEAAFRLNSICIDVSAAGVEALALDTLAADSPVADSPVADSSAPALAATTSTSEHATTAASARYVAPVASPDEAAAATEIRGDDFRRDVLYGAQQPAGSAPKRTSVQPAAAASFRALVHGGGANVTRPVAAMRQTISLSEDESSPQHVMVQRALSAAAAAAKRASPPPQAAPMARGTAVETGTTSAADNPLAALDWTLEQYAHFCAQLEQAPEQTRAICLRCGIADVRVYNYVHQIWHQRMQADPAVGQQFQRMVRQQRLQLGRCGRTPTR